MVGVELLVTARGLPVAMVFVPDFDRTVSLRVQPQLDGLAAKDHRHFPQFVIDRDGAVLPDFALNGFQEVLVQLFVLFNESQVRMVGLEPFGGAFALEGAVGAAVVVLFEPSPEALVER